MVGARFCSQAQDRIVARLATSSSYSTVRTGTNYSSSSLLAAACRFCSMKLVFLFILFLSKAFARDSDVAFTPTGSLKHLEFFQHRVSSSHQSACALTYNTSTILLTLRKYDPLLHPSDHLIRKSFVLCAIIGWNADCLFTWRTINRLNLDYFSTNKEHMTPAQVALALADDAQSRSLNEIDRPLAMNALLLAKDTSNSAIYKVDVTGNFWKCQAAAIGHYSVEMERWIRSKGVEMVMQKMGKVKGAAVVGDTQFCLELAWSCLLDVVSEELCKFEMEVCVLEQGVITG